MKIGKKEDLLRDIEVIATYRSCQFCKVIWPIISNDINLEVDVRSETYIGLIASVTPSIYT